MCDVAVNVSHNHEAAAAAAVLFDAFTGTPGTHSQVVVFLSFENNTLTPTLDSFQHHQYSGYMENTGSDLRRSMLHETSLMKHPLERCLALVSLDDFPVFN